MDGREEDEDGQYDRRLAPGLELPGDRRPESDHDEDDGEAETENGADREHERACGLLELASFLVDRHEPAYAAPQPKSGDGLGERDHREGERERAETRLGEVAYEKDLRRKVHRDCERLAAQQDGRAANLGARRVAERGPSLSRLG
jgi:hypothetical protein